MTLYNVLKCLTASAMFFGIVHIANAVPVPVGPLQPPSLNPPDLQIQLLEESICLAENIWHEARGEPQAGQIAVALVTLNRAADTSKRWPSTVCGVVHQRKQFSWTHQAPKPPSTEQLKPYMTLAKHMIENKSDYLALSDGSLFYHTTSIKPKWDYSKLRTVTVIGNHVFYKDRV